ncbi:TetR family transcriptional regulator [Pediococcus ethanolidurans]|uniref:TetR/AcrR family transcriptional regulator n=1 Tax=Pediococcus ethanolidurans TaxID=319653 RepID=UPI00295428CB|nr:TetR/AcrR family transcriptional regulator [Pediococcus ethanolidurans]MDV7718986.1 TetR family transcriptional regulator [Pediococcus ethanolidurans]
MTTQQERLRQTETVIIEALLKIGKTKPLSQISISDISRASGINRGTFYLHYLDKNDLINQITTRLVNQIQTILDNEMSGAMNYRYFSADEPYPVIQHLVDVVADNKLLLRFLLGPNGDSEFYLTITKKLQKAILQELKRVKGTNSFRPDVPSKYAIRLITNVILTIITTWIEVPDNLSKEAVCQLIMKALYLSPYNMLGINNK